MDIRKIIRESLAEAAGVGDSNYVTREVNADYYTDGKLPDGETISGGKAYVEWNLDIDKREWGINSFNPIIINLGVDFEVWSKSGEDYSTKTISLVESGKVTEGYHLKFWKNHEQDRIIPTSVEIDEGRKEIEISFDYP